jgi:uncharacterized membrane-anchored protein YjiN (DUF445 family)
MGKPKLERIALALGLFFPDEWEKLNYEFTDDIDFSEGEWNDLIIELQVTWNEISEGKIHYPENPLLEDLLKEYQLEECLDDFRFFGFLFSGWIKEANRFIEYAKNRTKGENEIIHALDLLFQEEGNLEIVFKSLIRKKSVKIKNQIIIDEIKQALIENLKLSHYLLHNCNISSLKKYVSMESRSKPFKGRPKENEKLKEIINSLYEYLQYFTKLNVVDKAKYSNKQARFIFGFLQIFGIMKDADKKVRKEDIIGYYLKGNRLNSTRDY